MKQLFLLIAERLKTVAGLKWIDLDKGQINNFEVRPPIEFPAVLVKIDYTNCRTIGNNAQQCTVRITLRFVWDFSGHTDSTMPDTLLQDNLRYFDTVEEVYRAFQGHRNIDVIRSPFSRVSQTEEMRRDGLKVISLVMGTEVLDRSAEQ